MGISATYKEILGMEGKDLGYSEYITVTQEDINKFADATKDHNWIHVDPEKAKTGPFGIAISHGFLTLSLVIPLFNDLLFPTDVDTRVNYGLDKVRFISPVPVGSKIRMHGVINSITEVKGGIQLAVTQTIEVEGNEKPAVIAEGIYRFYEPRS